MRSTFASIGALLAWVVLTACGDAPVSSTDAAAATSTPDAGEVLAIGETRFFGFVGIDCGLDDPHDDPSQQTDFLDEVSAFTNVAHVCAFDADEDLSVRLGRIEDAGLRAILTIEPILFEPVNGASRANPARRLALRSDASTRLRRWLTRNAAILDDEHVAMLYVVDEPAWNGLPMADLAAAVTLLDSAIDLPLALVEAGDALDALVIPSAIDLVGFDRYDTRDPATDPIWLADLERLLALRSRPEQRIVLIMDTQWRDYYGEAGVTPADMVGVARGTLAVAARTPEVVGIVGYLWPGGLDMPSQLGARDLPNSVIDFYRALGRRLQKRQSFSQEIPE